MRDTRTRLKRVERPDQIPSFVNESDEAAFWSTHELGEEILDQMVPLGDDVLPTPDRPRTRPLGVRFDADVIRRLRALAKVKGTGYQTLLKQFVVERLYEEEKRERLVG